MVDKKLTFIEHLEELRARLIKSLVFIIIVAGILYNLADRILAYLVSPIGGTLVFIAPEEAFVTNIKVALFGGLFFSSPFVLYQIWQFVSAGLKRDERRYASLFGFSSFILFIIGICFGYFVIVPIGLTFLLGFSNEFLVPMISVGKYVSFVGGLMFAFGVVFQLPLVVLFLTKIGAVTPQFLSRNRRYAIVFIFIAGALLTPPDVITQCLMAVPLILLYELGIIFSKLTHR